MIVRILAAAALLVVNVSLNLVFVLGFGMGTEGLTLAASLASAGNAIWLRRKNGVQPVGN